MTFGGCDAKDPPAGDGKRPVEAETKSESKPETKSESESKPESETESKPAPKAGPHEIATADGGSVFADHFPVDAGARAPLILLFHQAGWNAGEYTPIVPRLNELGFAALATDQRSGGDRDGAKNRTVGARGTSTTYLEAYPDLEAALGWAKQHYEGPVVVWGSSYSAALVFKLASEHPKDTAAVLSFSPGEYMGDQGTVAGWAKGVTQPLFVTSAPGDEVAAAKVIVEATPSQRKVQHVPDKGVHGSSILRADKNAGGTEAVWTAVEKFLQDVAS